MQDYWFVERGGRAVLTCLAPWVRHTIGSGCAAPKLSLGTVSNPHRFTILIWNRFSSQLVSPPTPSCPLLLLFYPTFVVLFLVPRGNSGVNNRQTSGHLFFPPLPLFFNIYKKREEEHGAGKSWQESNLVIVIEEAGESTVMQQDRGWQRNHWAGVIACAAISPSQWCVSVDSITPTLEYECFLKVEKKGVTQGGKNLFICKVTVCIVSTGYDLSCFICSTPPPPTLHSLPISLS